MRVVFNFLRESVRNQEIVLLSFVPAIGIVMIPLQHYMPLARFQHYSFSLMFITLGFSLQTGWSWRRVSLWGKLALAGSALFMGALANFLWTNPWLGNVTLATQEQEENCRHFIIMMLAAVLPLLIVILLWGKETVMGSFAKAVNKEKVER